LIVDTETHVLYRLWPIESNPGQSRVHHYTWHEHSGDLLVDEMDRAGVDKAFLISYDGEDIEAYLRLHDAGAEDCMGGRKYTLEAVRRHPDRFVWFATIKDPRRPDALDRVRRDFADGAAGVKIFPAYFPLPVDDESIKGVVRLCAEQDRRVIIAFEDTRPPATPSIAEYFEGLDGLLREFPEVRFQINHAGCADPLRADADAEAVFRVGAAHDNVVYSTALLSMTWDDGTGSRSSRTRSGSRSSRGRPTGRGSSI
jgi:predicted TIM-barrel fold metal-dependent hydrolase